MQKNKMLIGVAVLVVVVILGVATYFIVTSSNNTPATTPTPTITSNQVTDAPEGCPNISTIVVASEEAGTQNITAANSNFLQWRTDQALLILTNYTVNVDDIYSDITGDRVLTVIKLSHKDATALTTGTYRKTAEVAGGTFNQYASEFNISTPGLAGAVFDNSATVEITYMGTDYVCGTVTSDDDSSSINGEFIAKYVDRM